MNYEIKLSFIGQGFIGKNLADSFEDRGFKNLVRYSLKEPWIKNKNKVKSCPIVFIAVPTPTTSKGFDDSILWKVMPLTGKGSTVVIKSTILPTTARELQKKFKDRYILHNIEFLTEATARADTDYPERNVIGVPDLKAKGHVVRAQAILDILPAAYFDLICTYEEASLIKYGGNCFFYVKNMFFNLLYDLAMAHGCNWKRMRQAIIADSRIHPVHTDPVHKGGRGAGGDCLIKDFAAFRQIYNKIMKKELWGSWILLANEEKNKQLLINSKKDLNLLKGVYGTQ